MKLKSFMIISFLVLMSACAGNIPGGEPLDRIEQGEQEPPGEVQIDNQIVDNELVDREWILISLDEEPLIVGTNIILAFDATSFSGFAGCNGYGGPYEVDGEGRITFVEYSSQAEGCIEPEGVLAQESNYLRQLMRVKQYSVDSGMLTLSTSIRGANLVYVLQEEFDVDPVILNNSSWHLLPSEDFVLIDGSIISISFYDGEMEGFAGCRDYQGEYLAEGDQIRFPVTMMIGEICDGEELLIQEGKFTTALELAIHYQVQDDQLILHLATGEELKFMRID